MVESQKSPVYSKRDVDYRKGEEPEICGNCVHYIKSEGFSLFSSGACEIVKGRIKEKDVCNLWSPNDEVEALD
jgi:hypothetical protein